MRILFDQGTPVAIGDALQHHSVRTANAQGWSTLTNGELLRVAEQAGFEVPAVSREYLFHCERTFLREIVEQHPSCANTA